MSYIREEQPFICRDRSIYPRPFITRRRALYNPVESLHTDAYGNVIFNNVRITGVADPEDEYDVVTKGYVLKQLTDIQSALSSKLDTTDNAGGIWVKDDQNNILFNNVRLAQVAAPQFDDDVVTKQYLLTQLQNRDTTFADKASLTTVEGNVATLDHQMQVLTQKIEELSQKLSNTYQVNFNYIHSLQNQDADTTAYVLSTGDNYFSFPIDCELLDIYISHPSSPLLIVHIHLNGRELILEDKPLRLTSKDKLSFHVADSDRQLKHTTPLFLTIISRMKVGNYTYPAEYTP